MAATLAELEAWRGRLADARYSGVRSVRDADGSEVTYRSDSELRFALAAVDAEIAAVTAGPRPSVIRFSTSKGL